jgi:hypothetical protein
MIDYLSVYVSRRALKPSRATLRRLLIRVRLSMGIETLQSYTSSTTFCATRIHSVAMSTMFAHYASSWSHDDYFLLVVSS